MSKSKKPGSYGFNPQFMCAITPGTLGIHDAASPDTPSWFVGDTPGAVGCSDQGDPRFSTRHYLVTEHLRLGPRLAPTPDLSNVRRAMLTAYDRELATGTRADAFKANVVWAAGRTGLNPGFLAAVLLSEKDKPWYYVCPAGTVLHDIDCLEPDSPGVCTYTVGTDTYSKEERSIKALVPAAKDVSFQPITTTPHLNDAATPHQVTNKHFLSGKDAVLGVAVYLKYQEVMVRGYLPAFDAQPLAVQWGLVRLAMNPGIGKALSRIERVKMGKSIFVHGTIQRKPTKADSAMTRVVAISFHLSRTLFGIEP